MTLAELKQNIESNSVGESLVIFKIDKDDFIPRQYITEMALSLGRDLEYLSEIDSLCVTSFSIFGEEFDTPTTLRVFFTDELEVASNALADQKYLVIITKKLGGEASELYKKHIVEVPKLVEWQIKDYVYSVAEGVANKDLDWLISLYGKDMYRLTNELNKLSIFSPIERQYLFNDLKTDGAYTDVSTYNIFNITNALSKKDMGALMAVYGEIDRVDVSEFGLLALLLRNFKNLMMVQLQLSPTAESSLMDAKQFYAVKNLPKVYTQSQLVDIFTFLCDIDRKVKTGELPTEVMIDYMIIKILSM